MKRLALFLALLPAFAWGQTIVGQATATVSWDAPTVYEDGSVLAASDLSGYVVFYDTDSRFLTPGGSLRPGCSDRPVADRTDTSCYGTAIDLPDGTATGELVTISISETTTFYFAVVSHVSNGQWSKYSDEVSETLVLVIDELVPGPPTGVTVTFQVTCTTDDPTVTCEFVVQP